MKVKKGRDRRRLSWGPALIVGAALLGLGFAADPASAAKLHLFQEIFGSAAQPAFTTPRSIAVNQSTGDVLVMDAGGTPSIKRFNPDGSPADFTALGTNVIDGKGVGDETPQNGLGFASASESQIAVDSSGTATDGNIYVTQGSPNLINIFSSDGTYLGQLTKAGTTTNLSEACGVAVDSTGTVYVGDFTGGIRKYVPSGSPPVNTDHTATITTVTQPCVLAAGAGASAGFLFPARFNGPISKIDSATGEVKYTVSAGSYTAVTFDPGTGALYGATGSTINEFSPAGTSSAQLLASAKLASSAQGLAVRGSSGEIYASRSSGLQLEVFEPAVVTFPDVVTGSATENTGLTMTFNGSVNPDGASLTTCLFEYGETNSYGQVVPCAESPAAIGNGNAPVAVHAEVSGLSFSTIYHFRLVAGNAVGSVNGANNSAKAAGPPIVGAQWASGVTQGEATLMAAIDPNGLATTAWLEWGVDASYGNVSTLIDIGSGSPGTTVSVPLEGLEPGVKYHYRFVATNSASEVLGTPIEGADKDFTTYPINVAPPADSRVFELVSPQDKNGGDIGGAALGGELASGLGQSAFDGEAVTYASLASFGDAPSAELSTQYLSLRSAAGWETRSIAPPAGPAGSLEDLFTASLSPYGAFTPDLSAGVIESKAVLAGGAPQDFDKLYVRDNVSGEYRLVTPDAPATLSPDEYDVTFAGASPDLRHIVFEANDALMPEAPAGARSVYEWTPDDGLRLVSVLPEPGGSAAAGAGAGDGADSAFANVVSADGSRIFWTDAAKQLYVREGGVTTVKINASQRAVSLGDGTAVFRGAAFDGSKVVFTDATVLTDDPEDHGGLYAYDLESDALSILSPISSGSPGVKGVVGVSEDAESVYFVASGVLAAGASAGGNNLYLAHGGEIEFVAALVGGDSADWTANMTQRTARVTPDGRLLVFTSMASLTGYDNTDVDTGVAVSEVFVYDADTAVLHCASCNPSGARPTGPSRLSLAWNKIYIPRHVTDDGERVFFNSEDALELRDTNGIQDVYEFRDGVVRLISSGTSDGISTFTDASANGRDVFFTTRDRLVPLDQDESSDLYDARIGGGFPPDPATVPCQGESCRGPLSAAPPAVAIATTAIGADPEDSVAPLKRRRACRVRTTTSRRHQGHHRKELQGKRVCKGKRRQVRGSASR